MDSLRDRVYPVTRRSNTSECDVTFEWYCIRTIILYDNVMFIMYVLTKQMTKITKQMQSHGN